VNGSLSENSAVSGFSGNFPRKYLDYTISARFEIFKIFGFGMESTHNPHQ